jgi:hypothetical protein
MTSNEAGLPREQPDPSSATRGYGSLVSESGDVEFLHLFESRRQQNRGRPDPSSRAHGLQKPWCAMSFLAEYSSHDRPSDAPIAMDLSSSRTHSLFGPGGITHKIKIPQSWVGMSGYLLAGIFLGLVLILALSVGRGGSDASAATASANTITDTIVRLHSREIGNSCWTGFERSGPARLTVALEVGVDGKIRYAAASGETAAMRGCVEAHVKGWEFLPQLQAQTMALPFEVDRR